VTGLGAEVHVLMDKVAEVMVRSQVVQVRTQARACLGSYILDHPLGDTPIRHIIDYAARNLSYAHESGRMSALEFLHGYVIVKFPPTVLRAHAGFLLVALSQALGAFGTQGQFRAMVGRCIADLAERVGADGAVSLASAAAAWITNGRSVTAIENADESSVADFGAMSRTGAQVIGIIAEAVPACVTTPAVWDQVAAGVKAMVAAHARALREATEEHGDDTEVRRGWEVCYQAIVTAEKLTGVIATTTAVTATAAVAAHDQSSSSSAKAGGSKKRSRSGGAVTAAAAASASAAPPLFDVADAADVLSLLVHPHLWVRTAASRVLGRMLAADADAVAAGPRGTMVALRECSRQLEHSFEDATSGLGEQCVKNMVFLVRRYVDLGAPTLEEEDDDDGDDGNNNNDDGKDSNAGSGLESDGGSSTTDDEEGGDAAATGGGFRRKKGHRRSELEPFRMGAIPWLSSRLSKLIRTSGDNVRRSIALRCLAAIVARAGPEAAESSIDHFVDPVYRITGSVGRDEAPPIVSLAREVGGFLRDKFGDAAYARAQATARAKLTAARLARKRHSAIVAVADPEAHAVKRRRKTERKVEARKRKNRAGMEMRGKRGGEGALAAKARGLARK
jgi:U3 small nucleolar RNA-associated protein 20